MTRFFAATEQINGGLAYLEGEDAKHCYVLRLSPGERIILCNGNGTDHECIISYLSKERVTLDVLAAAQSEGEPDVWFSVYCAYPKGSKAEHIVQKATELGASEICFFPSKFCAVKYDEKSTVKKCERWQKISREAAQQSQRGIIPRVKAFTSYNAALEQGSQSDLPIFCYENERGVTLASVRDGSAKSVSIVTGSEGGFSENEVASAEAMGYKIVTLGKRILRCETAPLAVLATLSLG